MGWGKENDGAKKIGTTFEIALSSNNTRPTAMKNKKKKNHHPALVKKKRDAAYHSPTNARKLTTVTNILLQE